MHPRTAEAATDGGFGYFWPQNRPEPLPTPLSSRGKDQPKPHGPPSARNTEIADPPHQGRRGQKPELSCPPRLRESPQTRKMRAISAVGESHPDAKPLEIKHLETREPVRVAPVVAQTPETCTLGADSDLAKIVACWSNLSAQGKAAVRAVFDAVFSHVIP